MKIYRCKESLQLQRRDRDGKALNLPRVDVAKGMVFTAQEQPTGLVRMEGMNGLRLTLGRETLKKHFEELA